MRGWEFLILVILLNENTSRAQSENIYARSVRITFDNDYLNYRGNGTDRYYTGGLMFQYNYPQKPGIFFARYILLNTGNPDQQIAHWGLSQLVFTPNDISDTEILYQDRPYAGALFITKGLTSWNTAANFILHSEINVGLIGPGSCAKNVQTWIHNAINYTKPMGWNNQIGADIVLNYDIGIDKQVLSSKNVQGYLHLGSRAGTLFNDVSAGFNIFAGKLSPYMHGFANNRMAIKSDRKASSEVYFFSGGEIKLVLGNSLLQGGFIQAFKNGCADFYHIDEGDMKRMVVSYETGIMVNLLKWAFSFSQNFISAEFDAAKTQLWGRITITYGFN